MWNQLSLPGLIAASAVVPRPIEVLRCFDCYSVS
jgi:hypothetical protein